MVRPRVGVVAVVLAAGAGLFLAFRLLGSPAESVGPAPDPAAGFRVQHVIAQLVLRQEGLSRQREPLVLLTDDVNVFLARQVRARDLPAWPPVVRLEEGSVELAGRASLRRLLRSRAGWLAEALPAALLDLELWLAVRGQLTARDGIGEILVDGARIGRQPIPVTWLWRLLGARPVELLTWRMPRIVDRLEVRPGRILVHTRGG